MEGPCLRGFPRTALHHPVVLRFDRRTLRLRNALGNLSVGGLFVLARNLAPNTPVHVKILDGRAFEAEGVVREAHSDGAGIEFTAMDEANRRRLDELIEELTRAEVSRPRPARHRARRRARA